MTSTLVKGIAFGLLVASCGGALAADGDAPAKRVNFKREGASEQVRQMADWVLASGDNAGLPFMLVDKKQARVFLFHADGQLRGAAPALLGLAVSDESVPGIGQRSLASIRPEERRAQRLATPTPLDNRISYGCINVPVNFFKRVVSPAFKGTNGIVYVLPESPANSDN